MPRLRRSREQRRLIPEDWAAFIGDAHLFFAFDPDPAGRRARDAWRRRFPSPNQRLAQPRSATCAPVGPSRHWWTPVATGDQEPARPCACPLVPTGVSTLTPKPPEETRIAGVVPDSVERSAVQIRTLPQSRA